MSQLYCTNCGEVIDLSISFCTQCGAAVEPSRADAATQFDEPVVPPAESSRRGLYTRGAVAVIAVLMVVAYIAFVRPAADRPYASIERVPVEDAYSSFEEGSAIFLDVRDRDSYTTMHVPGAVWMFYTDVEALLGELPPDAEIITYCT